MISSKGVRWCGGLSPVALRGEVCTGLRLFFPLCLCRGVRVPASLEGTGDQPAAKLLMQPKAVWKGSENKRHHVWWVISGE